MNRQQIEFCVGLFLLALTVAMSVALIVMSRQFSYGCQVFVAVLVGIGGGHVLIQTIKAFGKLFPDDEGKYD